MAFFFIVVIIVLVSGVGILGEPISYWTHRKGYPNPGWKFLVALPLWLGSFGSVAVWLYDLVRITEGRIIPSAAGYFGLFLRTFVPFLVGIGGSFLVLRLLPKRKLRMPGSKRLRIPYAVIGYAALTFGGVVVALSLMVQDYYSGALRCMFVASMFSGMMFYQARRAKTPTVEEVISKDPRPPLLYLRAFEQELIHFVEVSLVDAAKYSEITSLYPIFTSHRLTVEQFLTREIQNTIGPLIALGNPTDYLPPEGASRTYAADGGWQEYFTNLSNRSAAILMQMGNSENLNWELGSIRERGLQTKLFVVTPPPPANAGKYSPTAVVQRLHDRIKGLQPASWDRFAANLEGAGYIPPAQDPGPGSVLTFDEHSRAMTIITGAKTPTEYVGAISKWIANAPKKQRAEGRSPG